jgi:hypothetical protein
MYISLDVAKRLQWLLEVMVLGSDDLSPSWFVSAEALTGNAALRNWQESVDIIYRLLSCNLLLVAGVASGEQIYLLGRALAEQNPFTMEPDFLSERWKPWQLPWQGQLLYPSEHCKLLFAKHRIETYDAPLCEALIEDVEALFEQHGVAWSDVPLVPIRGEPRDA